VRLLNRFMLAALAISFALHLVGCAGAGAPAQQPPGGLPSGRNAEVSTEPPKDSEPLAAGEYGIERDGTTVVPKLTLKELRCAGDGVMEVLTEEGEYKLHLRGLPQWSCTEALAQAQRTAGTEARGGKIGLIYREPGGSDTNQVNLVWGNGASVLYAIRGLYKTG
jgi:hypothetical protein